MITANKTILGKISLQKENLEEDYTQKFQENFKRRSTSATKGSPLHMNHPVTGKKMNILASYKSKRKFVNW